MQVRRSRDARYAVWLGGLLAAGGLLALFGYGAYYFVTSFFGSTGVPAIIQAAVAALFAGLLVLTVAAIIERRRQRRRESFREVDY